MPRRRLDVGPRALAHEVLLRVEQTDAFADRLLDRRLESTRLGEADRRLATQLVLGTLTWQRWLDARLAPLLRRPIERLDPPARAALRLGAFQLLRLDRVPAYAAIDRTVALAGHRGTRGLVNAVLRRLATMDSTDPAPETDPLERLAVETSHPTWLVRSLAHDLPDVDLPALLAASNDPAPTVLRVAAGSSARATVARALARDGIGVRNGRFAPTALVVERGAAPLRRHPLLMQGSVTVQSEASQLVVALLDPKPGERIVDLCAAPGGKAGAIAEHVGPTGLVVALDPRPAGSAQVRVQATRLGLANVLPITADGRLPPLVGRFDAVLVDAPCSGLGTLRRHPEIRWRRRPEDLEPLAVLQRELLGAAAALVRPGGRLVYAVCTPTHAETWGVVAPWLQEHSAFRIEPADDLLPPTVPALAAGGALRTLPAPHGLDGFFAVRVRAAVESSARLG